MHVYHTVPTLGPRSHQNHTSTYQESDLNHEETGNFDRFLEDQVGLGEGNEAWGSHPLPVKLFMMYGPQMYRQLCEGMSMAHETLSKTWKSHKTRKYSRLAPQIVKQEKAMGASSMVGKHG